MLQNSTECLECCHIQIITYLLERLKLAGKPRFFRRGLEIVREIGFLEEALAVSRRIHSGPHSSQAEALRWMAMVSAPEEAARCNREAREIWRELGDQYNYAYQLPRLASSLIYFGKDAEPEAEENFREGIRLMELMPPERQLYLADALTHFALLLERQKHLAEALPLKRRAVELALRLAE